MSNQTVTPSQVYAYLRQKGVPEAHARGMLANIQAESSFRPGILGDNNTSGGLFQHHDGRDSQRFTRMRQYAGENWRENWRGQIDYALSEPDTQRYLAQEFTNPADASRWFTRNWERPANADQKAEERVANLRNFTQLGEGDDTDYTMVAAQTQSNEPSSWDRFKRGLGIGAVAGGALGALTLGGRMLLGRTGAFIAGSTLAGGSDQQPQPMGFSDVAQSSVGQTASVATPTKAKTFFGTPTSAKNSGRSRGINKADALESGSDNLNDIENVLLDIRDDIRQVVANTKEQVEKPKETTEESIRAGFGNSRIASMGQAAAIGGLGMGGILAGGALANYFLNEDTGGTGGGFMGPRYDDYGVRIPEITNQDGSEVDFNTSGAGLPGGPALTTTAALAQKRSIIDAGRAGINAITGAGASAPSTVTSAPRPRNFSINAAGQPVSNRTGQLLSGAARTTALETAAADAAAAGGQGTRAAIARAVATTIGKNSAAIVGKLIPWAGTIVGVGDAFWRMFEGDFTGAGISAVGAAGALIPGYGIPVQVGTIAANLARDVYKDVYGIYPEDDKSGNVSANYDKIKEELMSQLMDFAERHEGKQAEYLEAAEQSGLYDKDYIGNSEVNVDMVRNAPIEQLSAILNDNDIDDTTKQLLQTEMERRAAVSAGTPQGALNAVIISASTDDYQDAMNNFGGRGPLIINAPQQGASSQPTGDTITNIYYGDQMTPRMGGWAEQFLYRR